VVKVISGKPMPLEDRLQLREEILRDASQLSQQRSQNGRKKMSSLTPKMKEFIKQNKDLSNRKLEEIIKEKFGSSPSYKTIGKYKNIITFSHPFPKPSQKIPKPQTPRTPQKSSRSKKKGFDFSLDTLKDLLDKNPDHILHDELQHQFIGNVVIKDGRQKKTGGKLRADLMKLFAFLRDVKN
jgi:hypothetical protein